MECKLLQEEEATEEELYETIQVMELFQSFTSIAASLEIPCDVTPAMAGK